MNHAATFRLYCALCTMWLFVLSLFLPFAAIYPAQQPSFTGITAPTPLASLFGDKVLICTDAGLVFVDAADLGNTQHTPSEAKCGLCILHTLVKAAPSAAIALIIPAARHYTMHPTVDTWHSKTPKWLHPPKHAPPVSFV